MQERKYKTITKREQPYSIFRQYGCLSLYYYYLLFKLLTVLLTADGKQSIDRKSFDWLTF